MVITFGTIMTSFSYLSLFFIAFFLNIKFQQMQLFEAERRWLLFIWFVDTIDNVNYLQTNMNLVNLNNHSILPDNL